VYQVDSFEEKTRGRKYRATIPLSLFGGDMYCVGKTRITSHRISSGKWFGGKAVRLTKVKQSSSCDFCRAKYNLTNQHSSARQRIIKRIYCSYNNKWHFPVIQFLAPKMPHRQYCEADTYVEVAGVRYRGRRTEWKRQRKDNWGDSREETERYQKKERERRVQ
jgi:hypothetical protein